MFLGALLYGGAGTHATEGTGTPAPQASAPPAAHVALLLPTGSSAFARPAEAVHAGFLDAWKRERHALRVRLYPVTDDPQQLTASYSQALAAGARIVVGPLTRNGVNALAAAPHLIKVPTLALNAPDRISGHAPGLYVLSLQVEAEARQVAQLALNEGRRKAFTVSDASPFSRRMRDAFVEAFQRGGGNHIADYAYATDGAALERINRLYAPYHETLRALITEAQREFGLAVLIDCHSMPSHPITEQGGGRPDFVLGDRSGTSCGPELTRLAASQLKALGYVVALNKPYAGGYITEHYGRPQKGRHSLQF